MKNTVFTLRLHGVYSILSYAYVSDLSNVNRNKRDRLPCRDRIDINEHAFFHFIFSFQFIKEGGPSPLRLIFKGPSTENLQ